MSNSFSRPIRCHDCGHMVQGSIKEHHRVCTESRKTKSTPTAPIAGNQIRSRVHSKGSTLEFADCTDVYLLIDVSGSMAGSKLTSALSTVRDIVVKMDANDRLAIITFDDNAFFRLKPRPIEQIFRQGELEPILNRIYASGNTALYDAIELGIDQLHDKNKKTHFYVLTDGEDNASRISFGALKQKLANYPNISANIIHINNSKTTINAYAKLAQHTKGTYMVATDTEFPTILISIFVNLYENK